MRAHVGTQVHLHLHMGRIPAERFYFIGNAISYKVKKSMHLYLYKHMDEFTATLDIWRILPANYYTLYYTLFSSNYTILR